jgi:nitric oxide synthase-interacting protein
VDSQKKFEQCSLCLKTFIDPMACSKGHIFCKTCIIENLVMQKEEIKQKIKEWEEENSKNKGDDLLEKEKLRRIEFLKKSEEGILELNSNENTISGNFLHLEQNDVDNIKIIEELGNKRNSLPNKEKAGLTKNCFWLPEAAPQAISNNNKRPSEQLYCPQREKDHFIKLKELIKLKFEKDEKEDKLICVICTKELSFQKIVALKKCGHAMCRKCLENICGQDKNCGKCNKEYTPSDVISLQESGSGFSKHNQVQTNKLNPFFKC